MAPGLKDLSNVVLTPHIASSDMDSREDMARLAAQNIVAVLNGGKPINSVYN
jgi:lactate dehydrogenase-like 2-hydroxyacid dehydrogenase